MTEAYRERIERGAALLTKHFGGLGWVRKVDMERLNLGSPGSCVLGQVFEADGPWDNGFRAGSVALFGRVDYLGGEAAEHGFTEVDARFDDAMDGLTAAWREYLSA